MKRHMSLKLVFSASLLLLLAACGSQQVVPEQNAAAVEDRKPDSKPVTTEEVSPDAAAAALLKDPKSILSKRSVYFEYDSFAVKSESQPLLEAHAKFLTEHPKYKMLIQGNADERGSREYNLALGQKRSEAVKKALQLLGGREEQIEAVSLGKEKPRCEESTEQCWAENRRADILYTGEY